MIRLASIIEQFESAYLSQYGDAVLPGQRKALAAMKVCRTAASPMMRLHCSGCDHGERVPHSCGHRSCPHCQNHESQRWLERQLARQVPASYFLITFTLPKALRPLVWAHQRTLYDAMIRACWETLRSFAHNDRQLRGEAGAVSVLHTHSRRLDYHPHVHVVMPDGVIDKAKRQWRRKSTKRNGYLFNHKALAKVFRAKLLAAITHAGLRLPASYPRKWVVDCKGVGSGAKALTYLGRYLYRGVIQEKDIIACRDGLVTFRYRRAKRKRWEYRTLSGVEFLSLILRHVLPKGFRRARNFGFLHPNSKRAIALLQWLFGIDVKKALASLGQRPTPACPCCGSPMRIVQTRIVPGASPPPSDACHGGVAM